MNTSVTEDGSALFLGLRILEESTVSVSNSLRPSLLELGLKQQPPTVQNKTHINLNVNY